MAEKGVPGPCPWLTPGKSEGGNMKIDLYTKIILTVIAICFVWHSIKPVVIPETAVASNGIQKVDIAQIGGVSVYSARLPVQMK